MVSRAPDLGFHVRDHLFVTGRRLGRRRGSPGAQPQAQAPGRAAVVAVKGSW